MAEHATSTTAPGAQTPSPLPITASRNWRDLWTSVALVHPRVAESVAAAFTAGVDPLDVSLIQLVSPPGLSRAMPRLDFAGRVFSPAGEVSQ